ncbi:MAG: hypothetical protein RR865_08270 [Clostridia bacterium]
MIQPIILRQLAGDAMNLPCQSFAGRNIIAVFQRKLRSLRVFVGNNPLLIVQRISAAACIGDVKHIAELGLIACGVHQRNAL